LPYVSLLNEGDLILCSSESVLLKTTNLNKSLWYKNDTLLSYNENIYEIGVSEPGNYYVVKSDTNGCKNTSDTLAVVKLPFSENILTFDTLVCPNIDSLVFDLIILDSLVDLNYSGNGTMKIDTLNREIIFKPGSSDLTAGISQFETFTVELNTCQYKRNINSVKFIPVSQYNSLISGDSIVCNNSMVQSIYHVSNNSNYTGFTWELFPDSFAQLLPYDSIALINWVYGVNGNAKLVLYANSSCASQIPQDTLTVSLISVPLKPQVISQDTVMCNDVSPVIFNAHTAVNTVSGFSWLLTPYNAGNIITGADSAYILWNQGYNGSAYLNLISYNNCGWSQISDSLMLDVFSVPEKPTLTMGDTIVNLPFEPVTEFRAFSAFSDSLIWQVFPNDAAEITAYDTVCIVQWKSLILGNIQLSMKAVNQCGFSADSTLINVFLYDSLLLNTHADDTHNGFNVYPNPTSDGIVWLNMINLNKDDVVLTDYMGTVLKSESYMTGYADNKINLSHFGKGVYLLKAGKNILKIIYL